MMDKVLPDIMRNDLKDLHAQLKALGFRERLVGAVKFYIDHPQEKFILLDRYKTEVERIHYTLRFERNGKGSYDFKSFDAMLRVCPPIPESVVKGINAGELDGLMKKYDWTIEQHTIDTVNERMQTKNGRTELKELETIMNGISKLYNTIDGRDAAEKLMFKYWMETPYEPNTLSLEHVRQRHEFKTSVTVNGTTGLTALQSYDMLKNTAAAHTIKTSVLSDEVLDKAETALRNGNSWMAYNNSLYFIDKNDVHFFSKESAAHEFAFNNHSDYDHYRVIHVSSVHDLRCQNSLWCATQSPFSIIKRKQSII